MNLKKFVRSIPDYPKKGILFRDITSLIENTRAFNYALKKMHMISKKINHNKNLDYAKSLTRLCIILFFSILCKM